MLGKINAHSNITGSDIIAYCKKFRGVLSVTIVCSRHETRGEISEDFQQID